MLISKDCTAYFPNLYCIIIVSGLLNLLCAASEYHHEVLDRKNRFHFFWKIDKTKEQIVFKIEVETKGYVAVGLSTNGGMAGSDIAIGWIKNGKVYLQVSLFTLCFINKYYLNSLFLKPFINIPIV